MCGNAKGGVIAEVPLPPTLSLCVKALTMNHQVTSRGGLRGGAPWASASAVVYDPMFFGTALHNFGRTYHICSVALGHRVLISNMNR